jgi:excisionase family DNA binding protein
MARAGVVRRRSLEGADMGQHRRSPSPIYLTVAEAAGELGIGESLAYRMANEWIRTGGATGIPAVRLGRRLLVSRAALGQLVTVEP